MYSPTMVWSIAEEKGCHSFGTKQPQRGVRGIFWDDQVVPSDLLHEPRLQPFEPLLSSLSGLEISHLNRIISDRIRNQLLLFCKTAYVSQDVGPVLGTHDGKQAVHQQLERPGPLNERLPFGWRREAPCLNSSAEVRRDAADESENPHDAQKQNGPDIEAQLERTVHNEEPLEAKRQNREDDQTYHKVLGRYEHFAGGVSQVPSHVYDVPVAQWNVEYQRQAVCYSQVKHACVVLIAHVRMAEDDVHQQTVAETSAHEDEDEHNRFDVKFEVEVVVGS
ncbi:hypothetical protein C0J52_16262 [Blattella germanica]|nr:hypothetical protein C0J52_16262 [Blattella germanica]